MLIFKKIYLTRVTTFTLPMQIMLEGDYYDVVNDLYNDTQEALAVQFNTIIN